MAIVQISQITNRKGLAIDLPQLAGAELGWSTDTRQLFIGNGTLAEGAPVIGNTEILTEFSDIINIAATYTYKGTAAGYIVQTGPTSGTPVVQSLQSWLDQYASINDFITDEDRNANDYTDAINRALYQLYCREVNPAIRRSLFFPAGVYPVSGTINIPSYANLIGEGADSSIIQLIDTSGGIQYVAQTADSLQQIGVNIGNSGATPPTEITISNMAFETLDGTRDVFLLQCASDCRFQNVSFNGATTTLTADISTTTASATHGIAIGSTPSLITKNILFESCSFSNVTWGIQTGTTTFSELPTAPVVTPYESQGIVVNNSTFNTLYQGVNLDEDTSGFRITNNVFNNVYAQGVYINANTNLNATGYNIFYNVGNSNTTGSGTLTPAYSIINIVGNNNISIGDMFERSDADSTVYPRVDINGTLSIATTNGSQLSLGRYTTKSGVVATLATGLTDEPIFSVSPIDTRAFTVNYTIICQEDYRTGTLMIASMGTTTAVQIMDDYVENSLTSAPLAITLGVTQSAEGSPMVVNYTSTTGQPAQMTYSINYLA